ncbi:hypothetical protein GH714_017145 [Hevea brasiliensis]|uniref:cytokinin dehydrogenase n=1 Tax=Hevea brasiliensis TaxID=3981 RepID=A0A6A6N9X8_HEVBR|nr:hypothetical protein GH714_017042 [Hevea brasiliensis]KAF2322456.1 hypothetical protein GH714_017145 [Hevea brasiliensis]
MTIRINLCFSSNYSSLKTLSIDGHFTFDDVHHAAKDFGNRFQLLPFAVLHPRSVSDIATTIKHIWQMGPHSQLTVAARGHGHSLQGQAQAHRGVVINMGSLQGPKMHVHSGNYSYVDVSGGELWINILHESLKYGLAPKSWTDYLHLTVGGTLSNAGISGQAFRYGPQISNVYQLEVVTGKGEVVNCSENQNGDLFHSVLGGLGQFGIITRARISLEPAPDMVKWIKVLYSDFTTFTRDQELLIYAESTFDYIEGFVIINRTGLLNNWRWDNRTSAVIPEEDIFYLVAFLSSAVPSSTGTDGLEHILNQNRRILEFCGTARLGFKQYLPHYTTQEEWQAHFGPQWEVFVQRKSAYDPLAILAPGQRIFQKAIPFS